MTVDPLNVKVVPEGHPWHETRNVAAPNRFQYTPAEKQELLAMIESLRADMSTARESFDRKDELDAERNAKRSELATKVAELTQQLHTAQTELDELNNQGSIRDQFIKSASSFEQRASTIASGVYNWALDFFSQQRYDSNHRELTPSLKEEILFRVNKLGLKPLTQGSFARLHKHRKEQITNEVITATMERVYDATEKLEGVLNK